jgi:hypothetical protein
LVQRARPPDYIPVTSRAIATLIVLILVQLVVAQSLNLFPQLIAIDFYQYWAVAAAPRLSDQALGSPYTNHRTYTAVLRDYAARPDQTHLRVRGQALGATGFTATPFLYVLFATFPADYTLALALFHVLQVVLFVSAVIFLGVLEGYERFPLLCLAFLLVLGSGPFSSDIRLGNLGCFQLAVLTVLLVLAVRLRGAPRATTLGSVVLTGLTLLVLAKPNVALIAIIMAVHLWLAHGTRFFAIAAVPAALSGAVTVIIPCVYFRSWTIWQEWYRYVFGHNPYALARPSASGNYSTPLLVSRWLDVDVWTVAAVIAAGLGLSLVAVSAASMAADRRPWTMLRRAFERVFADAQLAMAIGITLTIALPHLVWYHYYVIALIPSLWLLNASSGSRSLPLCGLAALVLSSGLLNVLFLPLGWTVAVRAGAALSWIPLWGGILLRIYSTGAHETAALSAAPPPKKPDERPSAEARPGRRPRRARTPSRA